MSSPDKLESSVGGQMLGLEQFPGVVEQLKNDGWEIREGDKSKLVDVRSDGAVHCVDGRLGDQADEVMRGPKIQGGVLGVAALGVGRGDKEGVKEAIERVKKAGFVPSVHGDDHHNELGCGFCKLWERGDLSGLPVLKVSPEEVRMITGDEGGKYVGLRGDHNEGVVRVNFVEGKTLVPDKSAFNLDAWFGSKVGVDTQRLLENAAETVVKLNGPKVIEVFS